MQIAQSPRAGTRRSWSPNTLRARIVLNYKGIPYIQSWHGYHEIRPLLESLQVPPLSGRTPYTLPAIQHPSVTANPSHAMNDSLPIALHLDRVFPAPEYPPLFPTAASRALAAALQKLFDACLGPHFRRLFLPKIGRILDGPSGERFRTTRSTMLGVAELEDVLPKSDAERATAWAALDAELAAVRDMLRGHSIAERKVGPFLEGETPSYADFLLVAFLAWAERADQADWARIVDSGDGELRRLWDACLPWLEGQGEEYTVEPRKSSF